MTIGITDLTDNVVTSDSNEVTGNGMFDKLMATVNTHLNAQYKLGRITGTEYANVYLGALQATVEHSVNFLLGSEKTNAEVSLLAQKEVTEFAQTQQTTKVAPADGSILAEQANLYTQQAKGFLWNAKQKHLKTILDAWSVNITQAGTPATTVTAFNNTDGGINDQISNAEPVA